jgi:uncharacterized protein (TIGR03000 family)
MGTEEQEEEIMFTRRFSALGLGALVTAALLWTAMPVAAQHGHGGGHGGGHSGGHVGGWGGHHGGWGGHVGGWGGHHGGWGHHGWGWGWGGFGLGLALGYPWGGYYGGSYPYYSYYSYPAYNYYDYYTQPYVYSTPQYAYPSYGTYTYSNPTVPATTYEGAEESSIAADANAAQLNIRVPDANAQIWIEGQKTNQTGTFRQFVSPPLEPNRDYTYHVTARWQRNGREMEQAKDFAIHAGDRMTVDFRNATGSTASTQQLNQTPRTTTPATTSGSTLPPPPLEGSNTTTAPQTPAQPSNTPNRTTAPANPNGSAPQTPAQPANNSNRGPAVP